MEEKISKIASNFNSNLESLRDFVNSLDLVLREGALNVDKKAINLVAYILEELAKEKLTDDHEEYIKNELDKKEIEEYIKENHIEFSIKNENNISIKCGREEAINDFKDFFNILNDVSTKTSILYKSSLMSLVVYFESMFTEIFKYLFNKNPECIVEKKSLTFMEIRKIGSIEQAINYIIEKELETMMYKGFENWCDYLKSKTKLSMAYLDNSKDEVVEIIARRNLFVHNQGKVNSIYLAKVSDRYSNELDKELKVNKEYINKSIDSIAKLGNLILIDLMKKNHEDYWNYAFSLGFDFLTKGKWQASLEINALIKDDKDASSKEKLLAKINYWQSFKWKGDFDRVKKEIEKLDCSAYSEDIQLAIMALKDDFDNFFNLLPKACPSEDLPYSALEKWPIFKEIRKDKRLNEFLSSSNEKEPL